MYKPTVISFYILTNRTAEPYVQAYSHFILYIDKQNCWAYTYVQAYSHSAGCSNGVHALAKGVGKDQFPFRFSSRFPS